MTPTEALDELLDTGALSREAFETVFQAGYVAQDPFAKSGWRATTKGQLALAARARLHGGYMTSAEALATSSPASKADPRD